MKTSKRFVVYGLTGLSFCIAILASTLFAVPSAFAATAAAHQESSMQISCADFLNVSPPPEAVQPIQCFAISVTVHDTEFAPACFSTGNIVGFADLYTTYSGVYYVDANGTGASPVPTIHGPGKPIQRV